MIVLSAQNQKNFLKEFLIETLPMVIFQTKLPEAIPLLKSTGNIQNFIIDARNFSFANHLKNNITELAEAFKNFIETEKQEYKNAIASLIKGTNSGNMKKGLK